MIIEEIKEDRMDIYELLQQNVNPLYVDVEGTESYLAQKAIDELHKRDRAIARLEKSNDALVSHIKLLRGEK